MPETGENQAGAGHLEVSTVSEVNVTARKRF